MSILTQLLKLQLQLVLATLALLAAISFIPTAWIGFPIEPTYHVLPDLSASLKNWNNLIGSKAEKLLYNRIIGPESMVSAGPNLIITGLADGRLIEINTANQDLRFITRFARKHHDECYDNIYYRLVNCGRPLGMRFDSSGHLLVVDAFSGLWRVNVTSGSKEWLGLGALDQDTNPSPNLSPKLFNDLVVDPVDEDLIYVSISSQKWALDQVPWSIVEHEASGLLVAINVKTQVVTILLDNLYFANGVEITSDKQFLLVSECTNFAISKINLASVRSAIKSLSAKSISSTKSKNKPSWQDATKLIKKEIFASNLPGEPDNIRSHNGNIYVAFAITRAQGSTMLDHMSRIPFLRKALARICYLSSAVVEYVSKQGWIKSPMEELAFNLFSGHVLYEMTPKASAILVLDGKSGSIKGILGSNDFAFISEAIIDESTGDIYFGSFRNRFLGRIRAKDVQFN